MDAVISLIHRYLNAGVMIYGIERRQAYQWGNTSSGYWRIAHSWILTGAIGDEALLRAGYSRTGCYYKASALPKGRGTAVCGTACTVV